MIYDRDRSGTVEPHEMHQAIVSWGKKNTMNILVI